MCRHRNDVNSGDNKMDRKYCQEFQLTDSNVEKIRRIHKKYGSVLLKYVNAAHIYQQFTSTREKRVMEFLNVIPYGEYYTTALN